MLSILETTNACRGRLSGKCQREPSGASTDTRTLEPGAIFFALRGKNYDGHHFLAAAFQSGACAAVVDETFAHTHPDEFAQLGRAGALIVVKDVYQALISAAALYRRQFNIPVVGVTGSAGKTTTKECVRAILGLKYKAFSNTGNFNNHIGVPLSIFQIPADSQAAIFELAANKQGDIRELCGAADPGVGVLTCIQPVHLEGFGSIANIYAAKLELAEWIADNRGTFIVYGDDPELIKQTKRIIPGFKTFGRGKSCDFRVSGERQDGEWIRFTVNEHFLFSIKAAGIFNVMNFTAAIAAANSLDFDLAYLAEHWHSYHSAPNRFEIDYLEHPKVTIVKDYYNSNPDSFVLALEAFEALLSQGRKIVVAGDMLELGPDAERYHSELGSQIAKRRVNALVYVGKFGGIVAESVRRRNPQIQIAAFSDNQRAAEYLAGFLRNRDHLFMKASRGMKFEEIIGFLKSGHAAPLAR